MRLNFTEFRDRTDSVGLHDTFQEVMALATNRDWAADTFEIDDETFKALGITVEGEFIDIRLRPRPGTMLKKILGWLGLKPHKGCRCDRYARAMDAYGAWWCVCNVGQIYIWLREGAERSEIKFWAFPAVVLILLAIFCSVVASNACLCTHGVKRAFANRAAWPRLPILICRGVIRLPVSIFKAARRMGQGGIDAP